MSGVQLSLGKGKEKYFNVYLLCFPIPKSATKYIISISYVKFPKCTKSGESVQLLAGCTKRG